MGEVHGVVGTSSAPDGAGVAAAHLDGGPDLVLDGSVDLEADTLVWEWGLERRSAGAESFSFRNPGGGGMTLDAEGTVAATGLDCPDCVTSAAIASFAVTGADLADDAVSSSKIADGAVGGTHLANGAVGTNKIGDGAVTSAKILCISVP